MKRDDFLVTCEKLGEELSRLRVFAEFRQGQCDPVANLDVVGVSGRASFGFVLLERDFGPRTGLNPRACPRERIAARISDLVDLILLRART